MSERHGAPSASRSALDNMQTLLERNGHRCLRFKDERDLVSALQRETFDLLVLDWRPAEDPQTGLIEWISANLLDQPPVLILSDQSALDRYSEGSTSPYHGVPKARSPVGRVGALLCRRGQEKGLFQSQTRFGRYCFYHQRNLVSLDEDEIPLTPKEFALALLLFGNCDRPLSRSYIMEQVWRSSPDISTRTLDVHISRIRAKMALGSRTQFCLRTISGFGYRLERGSDDNSASSS